MREKFIDKLYKELNFLPSIEVKKQLDIYDNKINKLMDSGLSEIDAISELGSIKSIINDIKFEYNITDSSVINNEEKGSIKQLFKIPIIALSSIISLLILAAAIYCIVFLGITYTFIDYNTIVLLIGLSIFLIGLTLLLISLTYYCIKTLYKGGHSNEEIIN